MSNTVKLAKEAIVRDFVVKRDLIHAVLEIDIKNISYFGRWRIGQIKYKVGNEEDMKIEIAIVKNKQKWDKEFWQSVREANDNNKKISDSEFKKLIKSVSKRPKKLGEDKKEKKVVDNILSKSW